MARRPTLAAAPGLILGPLIGAFLVLCTLIAVDPNHHSTDAIALEFLQTICVAAGAALAMLLFIGRNADEKRMRQLFGYGLLCILFFLGACVASFSVLTWVSYVQHHSSVRLFLTLTIAAFLGMIVDVYRLMTAPELSSSGASVTFSRPAHHSPFSWGAGLILLVLLAAHSDRLTEWQGMLVQIGVMIGGAALALAYYKDLVPPTPQSHQATRTYPHIILLVGSGLGVVSTVGSIYSVRHNQTGLLLACGLLLLLAGILIVRSFTDSKSAS